MSTSESSTHLQELAKRVSRDMRTKATTPTVLCKMPQVPKSELNPKPLAFTKQHPPGILQIRGTHVQNPTDPNRLYPKAL